MKRLLLIFFICLAGLFISGQPVPFILKGALKENRQQLYRNIVNSINKYLSLPLNDSTEDQWQQAFYAIELLNYRQAWTNNKIHSAFNCIEKRSISFQRALLELAYTVYPFIFVNEAKSLLVQTNDAKIFAMCGVYVLAYGKAEERSFLHGKLIEKSVDNKDNPLLKQLQYQLNNDEKKIAPPSIQPLFQKDFLRGNILLLSFQRRNRDYPGLVIVRDATGNFIKDDNGKLFSVPQLARSISHLPGYLTNGNTPEGIFRMDKFDTSQSSFIGPTTNIQLTMPFEDEPAHFYRDSTLHPAEWDIDQYKQLLPGIFKNYYPLFQAWYAGKAGRTEIIAHGTTIDPAWYKSKPFYPLTPTLGCLCSKEIWNEETGRLIESDQQKLVDAIIKAGGPSGYAVVIDLDDEQKPVTTDELLNFLPTN